MSLSSAETITFLYTDIEGSTRLWEQQPEAMQTAMARHNAILRQAIESNGGRVFRTAGDAFCASFVTAPAALAAALSAQQALHAETWGLANPLRIRVVLHTCQAEEQDGDYVGSGLNRVGRLLSVCYGGQTLLSLATEELVRDHLPDQVSLMDLGQHRFRDLVRLEHVYQLVHPSLPSEFPPIKSLDTLPNNLPVQLTSFIGRQNEISEVISLLNSTRLVTLTGS